MAWLAAGALVDAQALACPAKCGESETGLESDPGIIRSGLLHMASTATEQSDPLMPMREFSEELQAVHKFEGCM